MPIELPRLDDKTYAELVEEARAAIPGLYPAWTDHNPSDPGITLVELMAWLTEMLIYRTGRVPDPSVRTFLRLLGGTPVPEGDATDLEEKTRTTLSTLRERWRAVTTEDYEYLAMHQWPGSPEAALIAEPARHLMRVRCLAERDLLAADPKLRAPGYMSLMVVHGLGALESPWSPLGAQLKGALLDFFLERRVVSTRLQIVGPTYVKFGISATIRLRDDAPVNTMKADTQKVLAALFDPRGGGRAGTGWPFGRNVHVSDIYATLDGARGVESAEAVSLVAPALPSSRKILDSEGRLIALLLEPHELPRVELADIQLTLQERHGDQWKDIP